MRDCGTPVRVWSKTAFRWVYYPYQCNLPSCAVCAKINSQKREDRIKDTRNLIPLDAYVYLCQSAQVASSLIKRIKRKGGEYLRLSGEDISYVISNVRDKYHRPVDIDPDTIIGESIRNGWLKRSTHNRGVKSKHLECSYIITPITSDAPRTVRDKIFAVSHLLVNNIERLPASKAIELVLKKEIKLLTIAGYQVTLHDPQPKTSKLIDAQNGIKQNIIAAKNFTEARTDVEVIKYIKRLR